MRDNRNRTEQNADTKYYVEHDLSRDITADILAPVLGDASHLQLKLQGELTLDEFIKLFGGDQVQMVQSLRRQVFTSENRKITIGLSDVTETRNSWQQEAVAVLRRRSGQPALTQQQYQQQARTAGNISLNTAHFLLCLTDLEIDNPTFIEESDMLTAVKEHAVTLDDLLLPDPS